MSSAGSPPSSWNLPAPLDVTSSDAAQQATRRINYALTAVSQQRQGLNQFGARLNDLDDDNRGGLRRTGVLGLLGNLRLRNRTATSNPRVLGGLIDEYHITGLPAFNRKESRGHNHIRVFKPTASGLLGHRNRRGCTHHRLLPRFATSWYTPAEVSGPPVHPSHSHSHPATDTRIRTYRFRARPASKLLKPRVGRRAASLHRLNDIRVFRFDMRQPTTTFMLILERGGR